MQRIITNTNCSNEYWDHTGTCLVTLDPFKLERLHDHILKCRTLLKEVAKGYGSVHLQWDDYGSLVFFDGEDAAAQAIIGNTLADADDPEKVRIVTSPDIEFPFTVDHAHTDLHELIVFSETSLTFRAYSKSSGDYVEADGDWLNALLKIPAPCTPT